MIHNDAYLYNNRMFYMVYAWDIEDNTFNATLEDLAYSIQNFTWDHVCLHVVF